MTENSLVLRATHGAGRVIAASLCAAAVSLFFASATLAQGVAPPVDEAPENWKWTLGLGVGVAPDYEGSEDYDPVPIPLARAEKGHRNVELLGTEITSNLIDHPNWRLGPSLNIRQGYNDVSDKRVDNLTDRGSSYELGLSGGYVFEFDQLFLPDAAIELNLEFLHDVSSGHEGWVVTPNVTYAAPVGKSLFLALGFEAEYASGNYMSHYFSINSRDSANSGLKNYDADADFKHVGVNFGLNYKMTQNWNLDFLAQYKHMVGDASDSPVVDDQGEDSQFFGGIIVSYSWGG